MRTKWHPLGQVLLWSLLIVLGVAAGAATQSLWHLRQDVESLATRLTLDTGPQSTLLYDGDDRLVSALFEEHRIVVPLRDMSPHLVAAVLATEDRRFFEHHGVDLRRIVRSAVVNYQAGEIVQGGSTITQQLVRSLLLDREKSYTRKFKEVVLAQRLEERYSKEAILEAYLNRVYFGDGYYGVEAASLGFFGKHATQLEPEEGALLAALIKGPSVYSPTKAPELALKRRNLVLTLMAQQGRLTASERHAAAAEPLPALRAPGAQRAESDPRRARGGEYFRDAVQQQLLDRFGAEAVYTGGLRVYTTLDSKLQTLAEQAVTRHLQELQKNARHKRQPQEIGEPLQGALVSLDPVTGHVKAIVGGRDFAESPFNRAVTARRQPGSTFKPFIFAMALESGYAPSTELAGLDQPIETADGPWLPRGEHESPNTQLRDALVVSSNRAAAHLLQEVGIGRTRDLVQRFGVRSHMPHVPSLALGTGEMTLYELTSAYGVFANRGVWRAPTLIRRVVDRHGRELYRAPDTERAVISEATAFLMTSMMADVVNRGTASSARAAGFKLAAAGKTGTSQAYADAWFVGYTPQLVTGVWVGYDKPQMIMRRGFSSVVAVPVWARYMAAALKDAKSQWFPVPNSLMKVQVCRLSGGLATERCQLPIIAAPDEPTATPMFVSTIVREGSVFEELRRVTALPEPCTLPHGEEPHLEH